MKRKYGPKQVASLTSKLVDPLLAERVGMTTALMGAWPEIAGQEVAAQSKPLKIKWSTRAHDNEFRPGTLIVASSAMAALHLQHEADTIIERVNTFMGYTAISALRVQQSIPSGPPPKKASLLRALAKDESDRIDDAIRSVENERLQKALKAIGENIVRERRS